MNAPIKITWMRDGVLLEGHPAVVDGMRRALDRIADDIQRDAKQMRPIAPPPNPLDPNTFIYPEEDD